MKLTGNITLMEIIKRKLCYCQNDTNKELHTVNMGYIRGYEQILLDMDLAETEFIAKYLKIMNDLKKVFDSAEGSGNLEELSGYNNAIVTTLELLDDKYLYADD